MKSYEIYGALEKSTDDFKKMSKLSLILFIVRVSLFSIDKYMYTYNAHLDAYVRHSIGFSWCEVCGLQFYGERWFFYGHIRGEL